MSCELSLLGTLSRCHVNELISYMKPYVRNIKKLEFYVIREEFKIRVYKYFVAFLIKYANSS